jgi:predicted amidophosphoribosyltransferase
MENKNDSPTPVPDSQPQPEKTCESCEERADPEWRYCPECGEELRWPKKLRREWYLS